MESKKEMKMEMEREQQRREETKKKMEGEKPQHISPMQPVTEGAYGGGMYGVDTQQMRLKKPASDTQSADGPVEGGAKPKHEPPPSSGDRDIDITGQSYFQ